MIGILLTRNCDLGLKAASRDTAQDDIRCARLRSLPQPIGLEREPRSTPTTQPQQPGGKWGGFKVHIQDRDHKTDAGVVRPERGGIDKVAERCSCAYSTQIGGRSRSGQHSGDAVGGSQAVERSGRLAQDAGEVGRSLWVPNRTLNWWLCHVNSISLSAAISQIRKWTLIINYPRVSGVLLLTSSFSVSLLTLC